MLCVILFLRVIKNFIRGGFYVLDTVQKVGSKYFVHVEILKAFGAELEKLPKKEKILYDFKSAVAFLRPFLELAIEKNYTKDEIFDIMGKVGWQMNRTTFKHFWNLYSLEEENSGKKKSRSKKSSGKTKNETSASESKADLSYGFSADENNETEKTGSDFETQEANATEKNSEPPKPSFFHTWRSSSAHFEIKPDTEDL